MDFKFNIGMERQEYISQKTIQGVEILDLKRFNDETGALTELLRITDNNAELPFNFNLQQINFSELKGNAIKAFHVHSRQTDVIFVPPSSKIKLVLVSVKQSPFVEPINMFILGDCNSRLIKVPPGIAHGFQNLKSTTGQIIYLTDVQFNTDPKFNDEYRLPYDQFGTDFWEEPTN
jgi:dTDP-4-dehydrorhamnose 3,5-epimerase